MSGWSDQADLAADALLIRHFADLAGKLLNPIDRYVTTSLMPIASCVDRNMRSA